MGSTGNLTFEIVFIRTQWNHPVLSGCAPRVRWGAGWAGLSKAEEPVDTHWMVNVVDASICPNCGDEHAR